MALKPIEPEEMIVTVEGLPVKTILERALGGIIVLNVIIWIIRKWIFYLKQSKNH